MNMTSEQWAELEARETKELAEHAVTIRIEALRLACEFRYIGDDGLPRHFAPSEVVLAAAKFLNFLKTGEAPAG